jgi:hypothetical protein
MLATQSYLYPVAPMRRRGTPMLHASALAVGWRSALLALLPQRRNDLREPLVSLLMDAPRPSVDSDDDREPFHLDDMELALRLVNSRGLQEYPTPPHAHLLFPQKPVR